MTAHQRVIVLDFGAQYSQLIARRVRECSVYCELHPGTLSLEEIRALKPAAIILSGGPGSVYEADSPKSPPGLFELGVPVLGICYGQQLMAQQLGGLDANMGAPISRCWSRWASWPVSPAMRPSPSG